MSMVSPDCIVLGCGLSSLFCWGRGGVHVADDRSGGKNGKLAVCLGRGLEEGCRPVAERDVCFDDVELPSVPDDFVDAQSPWDADVVDEVDTDTGPGI